MLKPGRVAKRLYQLELAASSLEGNTLVVLPTGLGKTIIALMAFIARISEHPRGKALILSPTKPLVLQHHAFLQDVLEIPPEQVVAFTGATLPEKRRELWKDARIIVSTPQVIENDLLANRLSLSDVVHLTFDEAHRATGDYAYVYIGRRYREQAQNPLVLGITASPGAEDTRISEVSDNLSIERVEVRTESDPDVAPYVHDLEVERIEVQVTPRAMAAKRELEGYLKERFKKLRAMGVLNNDNINVPRRYLLEQQRAVQARLASGGERFLYQASSMLAEVMKVLHACDLADTQGTDALARYLERLVAEGGARGGSKAAKRIAADARIRKALALAVGGRDEENPKVEAVKRVLAEQLSRRPEGRSIVFTNYRDTADIVVSALENQEGLRPVRFVGQSAKEGDRGLTQKQQAQVLQSFRDGEYNVMVATSVAEEGLDIPSCDLVVFYEPVPSEIRSIQRRGRTGRFSVGSVKVLVAKGSKDVGMQSISTRKERKMQNSMRKMSAEGAGEKAATLSNIPHITKPPMEEEGPQSRLADFKGDKPGDAGTGPAGEPQVEIIREREIELSSPLLYADSRELPGKVVRELEALGADVKVVTLGVGDFAVSDRVGVERKTTSDLLATLTSAERNLFDQLGRLSERYARPLLFIEGVDLFGERNIHPNAIRGMLVSIAADFRIPIIYTGSPKETAEYLLLLARREREEGRGPPTLHSGKTSRTLEEQMEYLVSALPDVGPTTARRLLEKFGSVRAVMNANEEELMEVDGVGTRTAARILKLLSASYHGVQETDKV